MHEDTTPRFERGDLLTPTVGRYSGCCGSVVSVDGNGNVKLHFSEPPAGWPTPMWFDRREVRRAGEGPALPSRETDASKETR